MLQNTGKRYGSINQDATPPDAGLPVVSLADLVDFIRRRLPIILLTCLLTVGIGFLHLINATPTFTAATKVVIDSKAAPGDAASVSTIVETQIEILTSDGIASAVIEKLGLAEDPEFAPRDGGAVAMIKSTLQLLGLRKAATEVSPTRHAVESLQRKLSAKRVGLTYVVSITFESGDPKRAAQILNAVAETYIALQIDAKYKSSLRSEKWVKDRINELSSQASAAQNALAIFRNGSSTGDTAPPVNPGSDLSQAKMQEKLRDLETAAESTARTYDNFLRMLRYMEAQQQSSPTLEAHLLAEAVPPLRPSSPKIGNVLGISIIGGILLGIAIGLLRDLSNRGMRTGGQIWKDLQIDCIAVIPRVKSGDGWRKLATLFSGPSEKMPMKSTGSKFPAAPMQNRPLSIVKQSTESGSLSKHASFNRTSTDPSSRKIVRAGSPIWTITDAPQSRFTKSFLEIKLAIDATTGSGKRNQVIGITSTQPNEGKSTVAAALALHMAHAGARVMLVDCNLRNQSLSSELAPAAAFGFLDIVAGAASVSETMWMDSTSQLAFLPVGNNSRPISANDLLTSDKLGQLFQTLREAYEYIIVDLPAVAPYADVRAAAHLLDSFILVVEWGHTDIGIVERALKVCRDIDELMLGVTLNKADLRSVRRYGQRS